MISAGQLEQLKALNALADELHDGRVRADAYTFRSLREHVEEVRGLLSDGDEHWRAEAMDIIIHGLMLLSRRGIGAGDVEALLELRLKRFDEKITAALIARQAKG